MGNATSAVGFPFGSLHSLNGMSRGFDGKLGESARPYHEIVNTPFVPCLLIIPSAVTELLLAAQERRGGPSWVPGEFESMVAHLVAGCAVAVVVFRLVPRVPWPRPLGWRFVACHIIAAPTAAALWLMLTWPLEKLVGGSSDISLAQRVQEMMIIGSFFYVVIAGLSYSSHGAARAAHAEAVAAQTQLATLRSQLQPHFLFNALHTIVQLIHIDPPRAAEAAELVADLLRRTLEEERDEVPLRDEWRFVSRYLAIEQMRFGERLVVNAELPPGLESERVPSFALQTLVENAVQHGAAPRVAPTEIAITATRSDSQLKISVRNSGDCDASRTDGRHSGEIDMSQRDASQTKGMRTGTGLSRMRERLSVVYGGTATLIARPIATGGYEAVLTVPRNHPHNT